jgi:pimeloyl-ACP methyl ester carboxylesterase
MTPSESLFIDVRSLRYHVRAWGPPEAQPILFLHGWMDVSASFQFVVDELQGDWRVLAPDWRGFGLSGWAGADAYWYPDYLGDLDRLLDVLVGSAPATLVGHSMGGNLGCIYAGVRPGRIARFVNLEGLGLDDSSPDEAPERYARWLDELGRAQRFRDYESFEDLAARMRTENPRLTAARALFLAAHWGEQGADGRVRLRADPAHRRINPVLYRGAEVKACLRRISAPVLWVEGQESRIARRFALDPAPLAERKACIMNLEEASIEDAGHMLHHDQPRRVASLIEDFVARHS